MVNTLISHPSTQLTGELNLPGDKSISHRSLMLASLAEGVTTISGFLAGEDCLATMNAMRQLGVSITHQQTDVQVQGVGLHGLHATAEILDVGNSGTSMRLLSGILAGQHFTSRLRGDESLNRRPMQRIITPLEQMGARIESVNGNPPLTIHGKSPLNGIDYVMPIASAQVKSCVLLAGLYADAKVSVTEPGQSRDHTERMFQHFGVKLEQHNRTLTLAPGQQLIAKDLQVPADISSAAFFLVAASITPHSDLLLRNVGVNPTRDGIIHLLRLMGANIEICNQRMLGNEPVADLRVRYAPLHGIEVPVEWVANAIDEFPALMIACACATGQSVIRGAAELRVKESDRIAAMITGLQQLGITCKATPDGAIIEGGRLGQGSIESHGDHRIAMAFAMAGIRAAGPVTIRDCQNIATSFPHFQSTALICGLHLEGH